MPGYIFIGNSTKPSEEKLNDRSEVKLDNVGRPCLKTALDMGYDVILGINRNKPEELHCAELPIHFYDSHTYRSITALNDNYTAYKNLIKVVKGNDVDVIHCNTPVGGMVGRLVGRRLRVKKVIYTAHGFHFYKGAPLFNRTVIKWAEQIMAHWTDAIIVMNQEDYNEAKKFRLKKGGKVYYTPGVGIDTNIYQNIEVNRHEIRASLGLAETDIACISMGDLVPRKNYGVAIESIAKCAINVHYLICGCGPELEKLQRLARDKGIDKRVHFLGFRSDIKELLQAADIFLFTTLQEGMPRSMMEAMASGLPCVASKIRGNVDLLEDGKGGYLLSADDIDGFARAIQKIADSKELREKMIASNLERIKGFDVKEVKKVIEKIYQEVLM